MVVQCAMKPARFVAGQAARVFRTRIPSNALGRVRLDMAASDRVVQELAKQRERVIGPTGRGTAVFVSPPHGGAGPAASSRTPASAVHPRASPWSSSSMVSIGRNTPAPDPRRTHRTSGTRARPSGPTVRQPRFPGTFGAPPQRSSVPRSHPSGAQALPRRGPRVPELLPVGGARRPAHGALSPRLGGEPHLAVASGLHGERPEIASLVDALDPRDLPPVTANPCPRSSQLVAMSSENGRNGPAERSAGALDLPQVGMKREDAPGEFLSAGADPDSAAVRPIVEIAAQRLRRARCRLPAAGCRVNRSRRCGCR